MGSKIDEKTMIPLGWVVGLFSTGIGIAVVAAFWVAAVNDRLARIEDKLGIIPYERGVAHAMERRK